MCRIIRDDAGKVSKGLTAEGLIWARQEVWVLFLSREGVPFIFVSAPKTLQRKHPGSCCQSLSIIMKKGIHFISAWATGGLK